nr:RluA family pseudouridine synthase [uncultured Blautia sp.]
MERYLEFRIDEQTTEIKIEALLKKNAGLTKRQISQAKFRPDGITKNGIRCRVTETAYPGDVIRICLEEAQTASAHLEHYNRKIGNKNQTDSYCDKASFPISEASLSLDILYEDTDILAVNKPAGIVTHPTGMHYADSLSNLVASYFREENEQVCVRPVGRLDQETSGIVVFAKNQVAASRLQSAKSPCKIRKQYLAVVSGALPVDPADVWHTIDLPLMQDPENRLKMKTAADLSSHSSASSGKIKTAVTHYHTISSSQDWSLITLKLDTGRTHQIRVHMASAGHPLLGDTLYNPDNSVLSCASFSRAALHAWKVSFQHPFKNEFVSLEAPLPFDFRELERV